MCEGLTKAVYAIQGGSRIIDAGRQRPLRDLNALFKAAVATWVPKAIATIFLAIAIFIFLSAERRARAITNRLEAHKVAALRPVRIRLLAWILAATTGALVVAIWCLRIDF